MNETLNQIFEQTQKSVFAPVNTYAGITVDHFEQIVALQFDAAQAYADLAVQQARAALDIKDPQGFQAYFEGQQKVAQTLGERVKGDAEKVASLNQEFVEKTRQAVQDNIAGATKAAAK
ncbi:MAG TPA: phasin family protein [Gammaproteobacteria bacterium]|nr:phasin family protein [Gammaproteobacteria bacterium]